MDFGLPYEKIAFSGRKNMPSYGSTHKFKVIKPHIEYIVQTGDTLQGIALKHDITMDELKRINKIWTNDSLFVNRSIKIPKSVSSNSENFCESAYQNASVYSKSKSLNLIKTISNGGAAGNSDHLRIQNLNGISESPTPPTSQSPNNSGPPHPLSQDYAAYYEAPNPSLLGPELNRFSNSDFSLPQPLDPLGTRIRHGSSSNLTYTVDAQPCSNLYHSRLSVDSANSPHFSKKSPRVAIKNGHLKALGNYFSGSHTLLGANGAKRNGHGANESLSRTNSSVSNDLDIYGQAEMIEL